MNEDGARSADKRGYFSMILAVFMFSTSAIFVRLAAPLHPLTITSLRMLLGAPVVILISLLLRREWRPPPRNQWRRYVLFGLVAAAHFVLYTTSISYTTIAHALSITYTAPIWVTVFSRLFLNEPFERRKLPGVVAAVVGIAILSGFEPQMTSRMMLGDLLALGSAICFGLYSVAGRSQREGTPLLTYAATVYGVAALWMFLPGLLAYDPGTLTLGSALAVLGASVFPLGIGHTLYNAALRRLHPTIANVLATQEVTGGVLLGILIFAEVPNPSALVGSLVTLAGVIWIVL